jgi:hypothetical protein
MWCQTFESTKLLCGVEPCFVELFHGITSALWMSFLVKICSYILLLVMTFCPVLTRQFVLQGFFGLWIIVHRILNGRHFETIIALKLGRSFSSIVYLLVMVCKKKILLYMELHMYVRMYRIICNAAGFMHNDSDGSYIFFGSTFFLPCPPHKKGDQFCAKATRFVKDILKGKFSEIPFFVSLFS